MHPEIALTSLHAAPVVDTERHYLDGGDVVVDRHVFVVGMHDSRRAWSENHSRRIGVEVQEARVRRTLAATDLRWMSLDFDIVLAHGFDDRMIARYFRGLCVIANEPHLRRVILHPRIFSGRSRDMFCLLYTSPSPRDGLLSRMPS